MKKLNKWFNDITFKDFFFFLSLVLNVELVILIIRVLFLVA